MPLPDHDRLTDRQFSPQAAAYLHSAVHRAGADLDAIETAARCERPSRALDLGTGGGHVAFRLSPICGSVTAIDLSDSMLATVATAAEERGLANIATRQAAAESLPFPDGSFDLVASRFSAHHWHDLDRGLREARRVLVPGGTALFADVVSPAPALLDTHLQAIELLRDPSHVRDHSVAEWLAALSRAGFALRAALPGRLRLSFAEWTDRMATPEAFRTAIRALQHTASAEIVAHFDLEPDGSFTVDTMLFELIAT